MIAVPAALGPAPPGIGDCHDAAAERQLKSGNVGAPYITTVDVAAPQVWGSWLQHSMKSAKEKRGRNFIRTREGLQRFILVTVHKGKPLCTVRTIWQADGNRLSQNSIKYFVCHSALPRYKDSHTEGPCSAVHWHCPSSEWQPLLKPAVFTIDFQPGQKLTAMVETAASARRSDAAGPAWCFAAGVGLVAIMLWGWTPQRPLNAVLKHINMLRTETAPHHQELSCAYQQDETLVLAGQKNTFE